MEDKSVLIKILQEELDDVLSDLLVFSHFDMSNDSRLIAHYRLNKIYQTASDNKLKIVRKVITDDSA